MTELDLGQMFLIYNKALVARSSGDIVFFRREEVEAENGIGPPVKKWKLYHQIQARGFLYYIKGNIRI